jgi:transposase InsO family protein
MCKILSVNEKGYYKKLKVGERIQKWQKLLSEIHKILNEDINNNNYGANRMLIALQQKGIKTSLSSVRRAMRKGNLVKRNRRSPDGLTKADKKAMQPENLLKRDFKTSAPNKKWLTDITQVNCKDGKLYIAPVFDCFSGEIVSLAMDRNMKKELCICALKAAFEAQFSVA